MAVKRTHVYIHKPEDYEVSGCPGNPHHDFGWSDLEGHCWCYQCEKDYVPESDGIFGGPIPYSLTKMMGIRFDRVNIETGGIFKCEADKPDFDWEGYNKTWVREEQTDGKMSEV